METSLRFFVTVRVKERSIWLWVEGKCHLSYKKEMKTSHFDVCGLERSLSLFKYCFHAELWNISKFTLVNMINGSTQDHAKDRNICTFNVLRNKTSGGSCSCTIVWTCCSCYNGEYVVEGLLCEHTNLVTVASDSFQSETEKITTTGAWFSYLLRGYWPTIQPFLENLRLSKPLHSHSLCTDFFLKSK